MATYYYNARPMLNRYAFLTGFTICFIVMSWIFFTSLSASAIAAPAETNSSRNYLKRQVPRDNDANYRLPTYIPTHSKSVPRKKINFKEGADNDALYYTPVDIPTSVPNRNAAKQVTPARAAPKAVAQPQRVIQPQPQQQVQPQIQQQYRQQQQTAPLRPQPRQPQQPVYVPQYQQPQYQAPPRSIYVPPAQQQQAPVEEYYPLYYY